MYDSRKNNFFAFYAIIDKKFPHYDKGYTSWNDPYTLNLYQQEFIVSTQKDSFNVTISNEPIKNKSGK